MEIRCAYCHADAGRGPVACSRCKTLLHEDCFEILGRCPTLGCGALPPAERIRWTPLLVLALLLLGAVAFAVNLVITGLRAKLVVEASLAEVPPPPPPVVPPPQPLVPVEKNPEFAAWAGFGKGSFVEFEVVTPSTRSITRTTVSAVRSESITLETLETVLLEGNRSETHITSREVPAFGNSEPALHERSWHHWYFAWSTHARPDGDDEVELHGRPCHCRRSIVSPFPNEPLTRVWCSDEVPGRICRLVIADWRWRPAKVFSTVTLSRFFKNPS